IKHGDIVMIISDTRVEWILSALALSKIGATIATLYATLGEKGMIHGINETEITHIVTSQDQLSKLRNILSQIPLVRRIIYFEGIKKMNVEFPTEVKLVSFTELEQIGSTQPLPTNWRKIRSSDTAIIMYTSGSTGVPKGVMMSHSNVLSSAYAYYVIAESFVPGDDIYFAYLPLAHVLELAGEFFFMSIGVGIGYGTPLTMTDKSTGIKNGCPGDLTVLKPTVVNGVPLVLDRISNGIHEEIRKKGLFASELFEFLMNYKRYWTNRGYNSPIINRLVCKKIKQIMGGRLRYMAIGGAPLRAETHEFFQACMDIKVLQGYGLTEIGAAGTLMDEDEISTGRVGSPLFGAQIKLVDWVEGNYRVHDKPYPRGEILIGGPIVSKGYFKNEKLTEEAYSEENGTRWFHTGDIAEIYPNGTIKIVDRRKDLIKLQFGEYVSLGKVEAELKSCPYIDNICVIGDSFHDHLIALVVPNIKTIKVLAESLGKGHLQFKEICADLDITKAVTDKIVQMARKQGLNKMEIPAKIHLCSEEWLPDSGLVTAALKIRRQNIHDYYKSEIRNLYGSSSRAN
ncbi:Long chain acyl-CoA synthetase 9, partial [Sarcoptes scabiei]